MGEPEGRDRSGSCGEGAQPIDDHRGLRADHLEPFTHDQEVRIADDVLTGRTQVDHAVRAGRPLSVGVHVRHDVVSQALLVCGGRFEVDVLEVLPEVRDLFRRDREAELMLGFGEREPDAAPGFDAFSR